MVRIGVAISKIPDPIASEKIFNYVGKLLNTVMISTFHRINFNRFNYGTIIRTIVRIIVLSFN